MEETPEQSDRVGRALDKMLGSKIDTERALKENGMSEE